MGGKIDHMFNGILGSDHPATARAGHGVAFGHGADHQRPLGHIGQRTWADMGPLPDLAVIDLVRNQPQIMALTHLCNALHRGVRIDGAGWIVGRIDQQAAGPGSCRRNVARARLKGVFGAGLDRSGYGPGPPDRAGVGCIVGVKIKRGVARIAGRCVGSKEGRLPARRDQHVVARRLDPRSFRGPSGHRVAQRVGARHHRISGVPAQCAAMHGLKNRGCGANVMLANCQLDHRGACRNHLARAREHLPAVRAAARQGCDAL
mmetsp:Transcript_26872/g.48596  ORF Transcript_26872/g.48596 Transcript_26872/m.48596 type:complete len:261 (+) Transcript_26872:1061-1843(+)